MSRSLGMILEMALECIPQEKKEKKMKDTTKYAVARSRYDVTEFATLEEATVYAQQQTMDNKSDYGVFKLVQITKCPELTVADIKVEKVG